MALPMTRKLALGFVFLIIVVIGELYVFSLHFELRAKVYRGHFVVLMQILLYFVSKFIWRNLSNLKLEPDCSSAREASGSNARSETRSWNAWKTVLLAYILLCHCAYLTNLVFLGKDPHWFAMLAYCSLGSYAQLATALAIVKLVNLCVCFVTWTTGVCFKRNVISRRVAAAVTILYALCAAYQGLTAAAQIPNVKNVVIPVKGLSAKWDGVRFVQVSDIHLGPTVGFSKLNAIIDVVNGLSPDVVVITGDLVDGPVKLLKDAAAPLAKIKSVYGKFFVTGNHEYYTGDVDNWLLKLKELGITSLHNSNVKLTPAGGGSNDVICLAGGDDIDAKKMFYTGHGFDLDQTLQSCDAQHPVILLAHQPHAAKIALDSPYRVDLVLSGHTHGGQFFPMLIGAYFANPFFTGLYSYGQSSHVYVSQGTQYWGIPMRLWSTMEITHITLQSS